MNIFAGLQKYATKFQVKDSRMFNAEELADVVSAKVVASQYGMSVCFFMKDGCQKYIPVSRDSMCQVGDAVDIKKAKILILEKDGSKDIARVEI
jgi:hypothetical protein